MKIGYSKTFPLRLGEYEKSWIEEDELLHGLNLFDITDEDIEKLMANVRKIQYAIRKQVIDFHYESNKAAEKEQLIAAQSAKPKTRSEEMVEAIESVKELKVLDIYKPLAKKYPEIQDAYDKKMKELQ